jgi:DNA-binding CsgD family transcriptional regulator
VGIATTDLRTTPLDVGSVALSDLVIAAVTTLLRPYPDRVVFGSGAGESWDVGLVDPDLVPDGWSPRAGLPLVAISRDGGRRSARRAQELGVSALVGPDLTADHLLKTIEETHRGAWGEGADALHGLSGRELQVVTLICRGCRNAEIAEALFLSPNSVKTYVRTAYRKMGVSTRSQAVLWGVHRGL